VRSLGSSERGIALGDVAGEGSGVISVVSACLEDS